jgi:hypothetical protein
MLGTEYLTAAVLRALWDELGKALMIAAAALEVRATEASVLFPARMRGSDE